MRLQIAAFALIALTRVAPAAAEAAPHTSAQQAYQQANSLFEAGNWSKAADAYAALLVTLPGNSKARPTLQVREGFALYRSGLDDRALENLEPALPKLTADPSTLVDRSIGYGALATIYENRGTYRRAAAAYATAASVTDDRSVRDSYIAGQVRTAMFNDPNSAISLIDVELAKPAGRTDFEQAALTALKGRALLNKGLFSEAAQTLKTSVDLFGGMRDKVTSASLTARSDLALAHWMGGEKATAVAYFAHSGLGETVTGHLPYPSASGMPSCSGLYKPNDFIVVEFKIDAAGIARNARLIYTNRIGDHAGSMARAINDWRWSPQSISMLNPLLREHVRVELRCSSEGFSNSVYYSYAETLHPWLIGLGLADYRDDETVSDDKKLIQSRQELLAREASHGSDSPDVLPVLIAIARNPEIGYDEKRATLQRIGINERRNGAPLSHQAMIALDIATMPLPDDPKTLIDAIDTVAQNPIFAADIASAATLNLIKVDYLSRLADWKSKERILLSIGDDGRLPQNGLIRQSANANLYLFYSHTNRLAEARTRLRLAGIDILPCKLTSWRLGSRPELGYPVNARRWGFEGWVALEGDLTNAGTIARGRVAMSYPPLVFDDDAEGAQKSFHFIGGQEQGPCNLIESKVIYKFD